MLAYIAPILVFGLVVFVHELGHFLAAKAVGAKVASRRVTATPQGRAARSAVR